MSLSAEQVAGIRSIFVEIADDAVDAGFVIFHSPPDTEANAIALCDEWTAQRAELQRLRDALYAIRGAPTLDAAKTISWSASPEVRLAGDRDRPESSEPSR